MMKSIHTWWKRKPDNWQQIFVTLILINALIPAACYWLLYVLSLGSQVYFAVLVLCVSGLQVANVIAAARYPWGKSGFYIIACLNVIATAATAGLSFLTSIYIWPATAQIYGRTINQWWGNLIY